MKLLIAIVILYVFWESTKGRTVDDLIVKGASLPPDPPMY